MRNLLLFFLNSYIDFFALNSSFVIEPENQRQY